MANGTTVPPQLIRAVGGSGLIRVHSVADVDAVSRSRTRRTRSHRQEARRRLMLFESAMGMHLGAVVERGEDFVGQTVNIAARVADRSGSTVWRR